MFSVITTLDLLPELYDAGTVGVIEHDGWVEAFFEDLEAATQFGEARTPDETDWVQHTYNAWPPMLGLSWFVYHMPV